jgi:uncharacterized membrane protein/mono/diheme cytochrome c family protein
VKLAAGVAGQGLPASRKLRAEWVAALLVSAALLLLPWIFKLDGKPHADWEQFLGRFHPMAVHLPIGLIVLVPVLEIAGASRPALRETAGFVLALALAACLGTLVLGYLLAYGSGDAGAIVSRHMWGGILLSIGVLFSLLARPWWVSGTIPQIYPAILTGTLLALVWTAHQGGSITHGNSYLTRYMPAPLKKLLSFEATRTSAANAGSFYAAHVDPIFDARCVSCHGSTKIEAGLRLDSYEQTMKGGKDGPVIVPGNAEKSPLIERVTLSPSDKHFMPAEGRPPLSARQIAWIRAWVQQGASPTTSTVAGVAIPGLSADPPLQPVGDYSSLMTEIRALQSGQGAKLMQVSSKPSDGLVLSSVDIAPSFDDAQLAGFLKFAPYIVEADLGRTAVTDASFETLSKFTCLRALHLEGTAVTGTGLAKLSGLSQLTYLNLSGTKVTAAAAAPLASMKNLRHVYLFNTPAQPGDAAESAAKSTQ